MIKYDMIVVMLQAQIIFELTKDILHLALTANLWGIHIVIILE